MSGSGSAMSGRERSRRDVYGTEKSWCRAVLGGTGVTVVSFLLKSKPDLKVVQSRLQRLQDDYPILRSKLEPQPHSFLIPSSSSLLLTSHDRESTARIIHDHPDGLGLTPFHAVVEHEMNLNPWSSSSEAIDVMHATAYEIDNEWAVVIKLHTAVCDRTAALQLIKDIIRDSGLERARNDGDVVLGIEEYVPLELTTKPFWGRTLNMLGYSLNSFRLSNLDFVDPASERSSRLIRLRLHSSHTSSLLEGCKNRGIKLCGALSAAGLIAARLSKGLSDGAREKFAVVTLIDCRKLVDPPLSNNHVGFYHSAILNTHDIQGGEDLWGLASRTYNSFQDSKKSNKHFSDMADLNYLMCKAIENPSLTPSSSLRTSFISVFEDPVVDQASHNYDDLGIKDYMGCSSVHGVGPTVAVFDTIRDDKLDCACVYPFPLHSRKQIQELVDNMKKILIDCCSSENGS